jgi:dTDP-4-dehydrorhamnose 3,5-epimerase
MKFTKIEIEGPRIVELNTLNDERGFFSRQYCIDEFKVEGIDPTIQQINTSNCIKKATLRGFHYQLEPYGEVKFIRCISGKILDMIIDVRPDSKTYLKSFSIELTSENRIGMYIPVGFAHGYMSIIDNSEVMYTSSQKYIAGLEKGIRWNDPSLNLQLPFYPEIVSEKDMNHPNIY